MGSEVACRLGQCTSDAYRVIARDRFTGQEVVELDFSQLDWDRRLNDVSEATVQMPPGCCGKIAMLRPWRHELSISRDAVEQWCGPLVVQPNCVSGVTIKAQDMLGWASVRAIHNDHDWSMSDIGAVQAAVALIEDGYAPDDPNVLQYLTSFGTGVLGGRSYVANSKYVLDALKDLAQGTLDFTTIGRRIIVMEKGWSLGRTPLLTCDHFQGDLCTTADGQAFVSRGIVNGTGVTGTAGGLDPYYGLVERIVDNSAIGRQTTADQTASGLLSGGDVPLLVQPPQGSGMSPDTPVCLENLVPGVTVPVSIDCTCRSATQDMRLTQLKVSVSAGGETIAPLLSPIGVDS